MTRLWVLGAPDPEMQRIETILRESGEQFVHATVSGRRVAPASAYKADTPDVVPLVAGRGTIVAVECAWAHLDGESGSVVHVDHHRPGDPGYGRPPAEFLPASSLGQVIAELARVGQVPWRQARVYQPGSTVGTIAYLTDQGSAAGYGGRDGWHIQTSPGGWALIPMELVIVAAADHCLGAAYRGECPGVDPDDLMRWRAESRAAFQKRSVSAVMADIDAARGALHDAPSLDLGGGVTVRDLRGRSVPELPEAAAREGLCFVSSFRARDGRVQFVCQAGTPEQIRAFMESWAPQEGVRDLYGDPARGFAGGYLS